MLRELQTPEAIGDLSLNTGPKYHSNLSLPHFLPVKSYTRYIRRRAHCRGSDHVTRENAREKPDASSYE